MSQDMLSTRGSSLSAGFVALDVVIHDQRLGHAAGGTAGNVAANLAFFGWRSSVAGVVGGDPAGRHLLANLASAGVDVSSLRAMPGASTPVVIHEILTGSHRFRFGCPHCGRRFPRSRPLSLDDAASLLEHETPDVFFFDRVSAAALFVAERVRGEGGLVVFEPATPGRNGYFRRAMEFAHLVKYSHERQIALGDLLEPLTQQLQVRTEGDSGASWRKGGGRWYRSPPISDLKVVDAGGAGDWTTAALLASLGSLDPEAVMELDLSIPLGVAQAVAALSCTSVGARGLSSDFSRNQVLAAVAQLVGEGEDSPIRRAGPVRARRKALCGSCLSGASG